MAPLLSILLLACPQQTPAEIRQAIEERISKLQTSLTRLEAAEKEADRRTEAAVGAIESGDGTAEEKKSRMAAARSDRNGLAVDLYHRLDAGSPEGKLSAEAKKSLKSHGERATRTLREAEAYYRKIKKGEDPFGAELMKTSGWLIARVANRTVDSYKELDNGLLRTLPDDRPIEFARVHVPDPFLDQADTIFHIDAVTSATIEELQRLAADRKWNDTGQRLRSLLRYHDQCVQRLVRSKMILDAYSAAISEFDVRLRRALPIVARGVMSAGQEIDTLARMHERISRTLSLLRQSLQIRSEAVDSVQAGLK